MNIKLKNNLNKFTKDPIAFFKNHIHEIILSILLLIYNLLIISASFMRHEHFFSRRFDLGNMDQTVWNTLNGNIFMFTDPFGTEQISRLAYHADFILVLLAPFYLIWQDPKMLLLIQTIVVSIGGLFIYLIALKILKNKTISLALAFSYLIYPATVQANLYDFHGVVLGSTFLLAGFYFILQKRWWLVFIFLFLAGITKENVWATTAIMGLYIIFISKKRLIGAVITLSSIFFFVSFFWFIIPSFAPKGSHFALRFLDHFGSTPTEIILGVLTNPIEVLKLIFINENYTYLNKLFLPVGYLSILGLPLMIFASPDLAINLLSDNQSMKGIWNQYSAVVAPFVFVATIYGVRFLQNKIKVISYKAFTIFIFLMAVLGGYLYGPMPFSKSPTISNYFESVENKAVIDSYLNSFPIETKLAVTNNLGAHLSYRNEIYLVQFAYQEADYVLFYMKDPFKVEIDTLAKAFDDPDFELELQDDNFYVFKRVKP